MDFSGSMTKLSLIFHFTVTIFKSEGKYILFRRERYQRVTREDEF